METNKPISRPNNWAILTSLGINILLIGILLGCLSGRPIGPPPPPMPPHALFANLIQDLPEKDAAYVRELVEKENIRDTPKFIAENIMALIECISVEKPNLNKIKNRLKEIRTHHKKQDDSMERLILGVAQNISLESRQVLAARLGNHVPFRGPPRHDRKPKMHQQQMR